MLPPSNKMEAQAAVARLSKTLKGAQDPLNSIGNSIRHGDPCWRLAEAIDQVRRVVDEIAARSPDLAAIAHWYRTCFDPPPDGGAHPDPCTELHRLYGACSSVPWTCGARMEARDDCTAAWGRIEQNMGNGDVNNEAFWRRRCRERARHAAWSLFRDLGLAYLEPALSTWAC